MFLLKGGIYVPQEIESHGMENSFPLKTFSLSHLTQRWLQCHHLDFYRDSMTEVGSALGERVRKQKARKRQLSILPFHGRVPTDRALAAKLHSRTDNDSKHRVKMTRIACFSRDGHLLLNPGLSFLIWGSWSDLPNHGDCFILHIVVV